MLNQVRGVWKYSKTLSGWLDVFSIETKTTEKMVNYNRSPEYCHSNHSVNGHGFQHEKTARYMKQKTFSACKMLGLFFIIVHVFRHLHGHNT